MSFWSKLGVVAATVGGAVVGGPIGAIAAGGVAGKIASKKNERDNDKFLDRLQCDPAMQMFVAQRFPGALYSINSMTDHDIATIRHAWEGSSMERRFR